MSTVAQAHGLDGALVEPDWPPLTTREVQRVLRQFAGLAGNVRLLSVSPRPFSAASVVQARTRRVFVKRHALTVRNAAALREEHAFMLYLGTHGASVPRVLANESGETAIELGEWTYEVHELPDGIDLYADAISWTPFFHAAHAYSAGRALATLHQAAEGYDAPRRNRPLVAGFRIFSSQHPEAALETYLGSRPQLAEYVGQGNWLRDAMDLLHSFYAELAPLLPALSPLWTHNDLHPSNLFWSNATAGAQATAVIDFGLSDRTTAVHDIAHAVERSIVEWLALVQHPGRPEDVPVHLDHLAALLDGYESVRPLSAAERAALPSLTALCHIEFALSEADYFLSTLHSEEKARIAIEGYALGHARWWRGAGSQLLDAIRTRKEAQAQ